MLSQPFSVRSEGVFPVGLEHEATMARYGGGEMQTGTILRSGKTMAEWPTQEDWHGNKDHHDSR